jgi:hypothetical protein
MNCLWEHLDDPSGLRTYRCGRPTCPLHKKRIRIPASSIRLEPHRCTGIPLQHEWGNWLSIWLGLFGITDAGVAWWLARLRIPFRCGCKKRATALNTLGSRFHQALACLTRYNTRKGER